MSFSVAARSAFLPSLSARARAALPLGPSACATRQKRAPRRSLEWELFRREVWRYWRENGRHDLPWRKTKDPYRILVSEIMLQQTQVPRVKEKYREFLKTFPNIRTLASAPLGRVLRVWSGLGYNRRAKYLHDGAKQMMQFSRGRVPMACDELRKLPGIGPYTASAVRVFAFNEPDILIETNIRTALIHHFFPTNVSVPDKQLATLLSKVTERERENAREWHWALMDYGAYLKRSGVRNNHRSTHYSEQSKFEGSIRQLRGAILRELQSDPKTDKSLYSLIRTNKRITRVKILRAIRGLARDGLIVQQKGKWRII